MIDGRHHSWEATEFHVEEASQVRLAELAAEMGVELFVIDDGWFHGRDNDNAGLGDWWPDERKFPNGLSPLIARIQALGTRQTAAAVLACLISVIMEGFQKSQPTP